MRAALLNRLRDLETVAKQIPSRAPRQITPGMSLAEAQNEWQLALEEAKALAVEASPAEARDPAQLDRLAAAFAQSIGAQVEESEAQECADGEKPAPKKRAPESAESPWATLKARAERALSGGRHGG
jgi:hypothetical protein